MSDTTFNNWPSARHFAEALQCPALCFSNPLLRETLPAVDRLGMPLVTSGQFAYVYKLNPHHGANIVAVGNNNRAFAVRCFRSYLGDREQRYRAIDEHLRAQRIPALASFAYEAEGILVGGRRFPIQFMEWIEGTTLDVYLDEVIERPEVLQHLASEWLKLVKSLREAGIAHGDLQHGNIIVEHGQLRLVDLDGMFVPSMKNWTAGELGHQHFQHPARDEQFFDATLDNFSALVIYLSLISLAERPALWTEYHDENLIFTKADFLDPKASTLFAKIKEIGSEHQKLAEALEAAASKSDPSTVPHLLDLVDVTSKLPSWMNAPLNLEVVRKTREAQRIETTQTASAADNRWASWQQPLARAMPASPVSSTVQSVFSAPAAVVSASPGNTTNLTIYHSSTGPALNPLEIGKNTRVYARELVTRRFLVWYWAFYFAVNLTGLGFFYSILLAVSLIATISLVYGFLRARREAHAALFGASSGSLVPAAATAAATSSVKPAYVSSAKNAATAVASSGSFVPVHSVTAPIIANKTLGIYHAHDCVWVDRMSLNKRIEFGSAIEARNAGYRPCKVCAP